MRELQRQSGVTCIMVTHSAELASRVDSVIRLRDGRVVKDAMGVSGEQAVVRQISGVSHLRQRHFRASGE